MRMEKLQLFSSTKLVLGMVLMVCLIGFGFVVVKSELVSNLNTIYTDADVNKKTPLIVKGMAIDEVRQILGEEFLRYPTGKYPVCLAYSRRRLSWFNYNHLVVCFDAEESYTETFNWIF